ncbi:GGDEF domain-containing protein [Rubrobacter calidifluminis]|uniref:GGDEF domain-containing protein n=1 Tax=Rubrobacter calidifluminis TaxID=1392640 RepID=UPI00235E0797|nr:GGDEF domain-containing protein [Rubrobacter calidifluminis]
MKVVDDIETIALGVESCLPGVIERWAERRLRELPEGEAGALSRKMGRLVEVFVEFLRSPETVETFSLGGRTRGLVREVATAQYGNGRDAVGVIEDFATLRRVLWESVERELDFSGFGGDVVARFFVKLMQASDWVTHAALEEFDVMVRREMEEAMGRAAATDLLTGLPDRDLFGRLLLPRAVGDNERLSVVVFDLAGLSEVVAAGEVERARDAVRALAETVQRVVPEGAVCARFGDDEISALLPGVGAEEAYGIAENVVARMGGMQVGLQVDAGIAEYPTHAGEPGALLNEALKALNMAKRMGGGGIVAARSRT